MIFSEKLPISLHLEDLQLIDSSKSSLNKKILLYKHPELGRVFILGSEIQHIESWSHFYHESLVHLPCAFLEKVETVLILGGGCFFTANEVLKYSSIKKVVMIEHDSKVVELIARNYKHAAKILKDNRFNLHISDAFDWINNTEQKFDLILNDSVDLVNDLKIKKNKIFGILSSKLNENGVCCDLIYRHIFEKKTTQNTLKLLKKNKIRYAFSLVTVPEYPGILHLLVIWGLNNTINQKLNLSRNEIQKKWTANKSLNPCKFYNSKFLDYYLYLPPYLKKFVNESENI